MRQRIQTGEDLSWLLEHTRRFQGGQITDLHVHKRRLFDEGSGREVIAGTVLTAVIRYDLPGSASDGFFGVTRIAKLTMYGVSDFSIFEQEGSDCSEVGVIHAEATGGRLRFWFDPHGELYVICEEASLEEVAMPGIGRQTSAGITDWTFQAHDGTLPDVAWFLEHLDQAGIPCVWRAARRAMPAHPAWCWEGHLMPTSKREASSGSQVHIQTFGPLDGCGFGVTLRSSDAYAAEGGRLLLVLAEIIVRHFEGTCLTGRHIVERDEWCGVEGAAPPKWWEISSGRGEGISQNR